MNDVRPRSMPAAATPAAATPAAATPPSRRSPWITLPALAAAFAGFAAVALAAPAVAATSAKTSAKTSVSKIVAENWTGPSANYHAITAFTRMAVVSTPDAVDGKALRLQMKAYPDPGPHGGAVIASNKLYHYGSYGTRMKTADCAGQDHPGVVTGTFTYSFEHPDANHNGVTDNDEIDIEFLCGQPDVIYLTIWTDYSETSNDLREITRAVNLRTGKVLRNCYIVSYGTGCQPLLAGENTPASTPAIAGFNSAKQFRSYSFDWQPDSVTFYTCDDAGHKIVLWDYRGPKSRIPNKPGYFMQNVQHTRTWDPMNGPSHNQPTVSNSAFIDSTFVPN